MNRNERPWYFWPLIAFFIGLLIGWLVIGWGLWPVTWTNALVRDLRPDLRNDYVAMVAESFAQTRNIEVAGERLSGWTDEERAQLFDEVGTVLAARDPQGARNLQDLNMALGGTRGTGPEPSPQVTTQPQPTPTSSTPPAEDGINLGDICTAGLFVLLALGALVVLIVLFNRWRRAQREGEGPMDAPDFDASDPSMSVLADREKGRWPSTGEPWAEVEPRPVAGSTVKPRRYTDLDEDRIAPPAPVVSADRDVSSVRPIGPVPRVSEPQTPADLRGAPKPPPAEERPRTEIIKLDENVAVYQMGEPDYDEAFDINDPTDGYMGQYGLQLVEPFGKERDQAVALQVWLWDSSDPFTQTAVLMSEGAYRDTSIRSQHMGEHEIIGVRPGSEFELSSHNLLLRGRVEKATYAEMEPLRGVFAELHVKLTIYRRG